MFDYVGKLTGDEIHDIVQQEMNILLTAPDWAPVDENTKRAALIIYKVYSDRPVVKTGDELMKDASWLIQELRDGPVEVKFTKADGTERLMICTLAEDLIPSEKLPKTAKQKVEKTSEAIRVFDLQTQDWRSFRYDSITKAVS